MRPTSRKSKRTERREPVTLACSKTVPNCKSSGYFTIDTPKRLRCPAVDAPMTCMSCYITAIIPNQHDTQYNNTQSPDHFGLLNRPPRSPALGPLPCWCSTLSILSLSLSCFLLPPLRKVKCSFLLALFRPMYHPACHIIIPPCCRI